MNTQTRIILAAAVVAVVMIGGVATTYFFTRASDSTPATQGPTATSKALTPAPAPHGQAGQNPDPADVANPPWTDEAKASAVQVAVKAMGLYARPKTPPAIWLADLAPMTTQEFQAEYAKTNTAYIGISRADSTGKLDFVPENGFGCTVTVGTDAGTYTVQLLRIDATHQWRVNRIVPPLGKAGQ